MAKSAQAFRTIREVADWLGVAAHVLRFWESKFSQIKPVKRAGGRRYYRPSDMALVGGIKVLLHDQGMTIRGVQKMISEDGLDAISALSPPLDEMLEDPNVIELAPSEAWEEDAEAEASVAAAEPEAEPEPDPAPEPEPETVEDAEEDAATDAPPLPLDPVPEEEPEVVEAAEASPEPEDAAPEPDAPALPPSDAAEGRMGQLAALVDLPQEARARLAPQVAALSALARRMARPHDAP